MTAQRWFCTKIAITLSISNVKVLLREKILTICVLTSIFQLILKNWKRKWFYFNILKAIWMEQSLKLLQVLYLQILMRDTGMFSSRNGNEQTKLSFLDLAIRSFKLSFKIAQNWFFNLVMVKCHLSHQDEKWDMHLYTLILRTTIHRFSRD